MLISDIQNSQDVLLGLFWFSEALCTAIVFVQLRRLQFLIWAPTRGNPKPLHWDFSTTLVRVELQSEDFMISFGWPISAEMHVVVKWKSTVDWSPPLLGKIEKDFLGSTHSIGTPSSNFEFSIGTVQRIFGRKASILMVRESLYYWTLAPLCCKTNEIVTYSNWCGVVRILAIEDARDCQ